jgi:hypothetical protein
LVAKAWLHYDNEGTATIDDSENVASVDDDAVGAFTVHWDTDFATTDYGVVSCGIDNDVAGHNYIVVDRSPAPGSTPTHLVGSCEFHSQSIRNDALVDIPEISVVAFGDLVSAPTVDHPRLIPKAWVSYDQTGTPATLDSENVASVTDVTTGEFTPVWDTDFANTSYTLAVGTNWDSGPDLRITLINEIGTGSGHLVGSCTMGTWTAVNTKDPIDADYNLVVAYGDQ